MNTDIPVDSLPSKGYGYDFNLLEIPQLVFSQILDYQAELEKQKNELSTLLVQLKHLVLSLKNGPKISMYDALPVMAIRTYTSASDKLTDYLKIKYFCPVHQKKEIMEVKLGSMIFNDIEPDLTKIDSIRLNGNYYKFEIPTVQKFIDTANKFKMTVPLSHAVKFIWLLSMFKDILGNEEDKFLGNKILKDLMNADAKDIVVLNKLYSMLTNSFTGFKATCKNGGEPVIVDINSISPITDIFRNILQTEEFDKTAIKYREIDED